MFAPTLKLTGALSVLLRLLAPFLPFVTEEVWSWWQSGSIHLAPWPTASEVESLLADNSIGARQHDQRVADWATDVLFEVRKQRSEAKQPMRVPITRVTISDTPRCAFLVVLKLLMSKCPLRHFRCDAKRLIILPRTDLHARPFDFRKV